VNEDEVVQQIFEEWAKRRYRSEEYAWLAWLLRFVLPTASDPKDRFREVPNALSPIAGKYGPWNHVVIDEAQDLSVTEASFLSSFAIRNGALTISADFKQVVSPVHGMEDLSPFRIGCPLLDKGDELNRFPFTKNMRQTAQIGRFLRDFYERVFGETPQFDANEELHGPKPQLHILPFSQYALTLKRALNVIKQKGFSGSIALIQINEDEDEMVRLRKMLEDESISLAPIWAPNDGDNHLITTSVERIKGLEYDICFVIGMENAEHERLNYNKNRVYVSLSRPTQRLYMLCEQFPVLLKHIQGDLMEQYDMRNF